MLRMILSVDLVRMAPGVASMRFLAMRRAARTKGAARFIEPFYLARFTTLPGPVPSYVSFGVISGWESQDDLGDFRASSPWGSARAHAGLTLSPYKVRGTWDAAAGLTSLNESTPAGPVAVVTRARTAAAYHPATWRANPAIVRSLRENQDVLWTAPFADRAFGVIGTFSIWPDDASAVRFAYGKDAHAPVIGQAKKGSWLPESWFARASIIETVGRWPGLPALSTAE